MRILITGARGMLGKEASAYFTVHGHQVLGTARNPGDSNGLLALDVTDIGQILATFATIRPDVILHCAAYTNVDGCERDPETAYRQNGYGTWCVAAGAESVGAALVAVSTDFVFDGKRSLPYTEVDATGPLSHYGGSKLAGEKLAMQACSRTYVVRTSWLYGVHGPNFPLTIIKRARENGAQNVVADQYGTPTYTLDLVRAIEEIIRVPLYGVYHASNSGETTWQGFARAVLDRVGLESVPVNPLTSAECAVKFNTPTERPAYSVMRNWALEMENRDPMRPWTEALDAFITEAKADGKI